MSSVTSDAMQDPGGAGRSRGASAGGDADARTWVHPSELGLRTRTRSDRRRGTWLSIGLIVVGIGLLGFGAVMGLSSSGRAATAGSATEAVAATLAEVTVVRGTDRRTVTGVVVDGRGHVAVRAAAVDGADEVWANCGGHGALRATRVDRDARALVAVLTVPSSGTRTVATPGTTAAGDVVRVAHVGTGEGPPVIEHARVEVGDRPDRDAATAVVQMSTPSADRGSSTTAETQRSITTTAATVDVGDRPEGSDDGAVFDLRGRFVGIVVDGDGPRRELVPAAAVVRAADALAP